MAAAVCFDKQTCILNDLTGANKKFWSSFGTGRGEVADRISS